MEPFDTSARIAVLETEVKNIANSVRDLQLDQKTEFSSINEKIERISRRIEAIERWKWTVMGGAAVLGFLVSHVFKGF